MQKKLFFVKISLILLILVIISGCVKTTSKNTPEIDNSPNSEGALEIINEPEVAVEKEAVEDTGQEAPREIKISAKRWEYSPEIIEVKKGEKIKLTIDNIDTTHGIIIPDLDISGNDEVIFSADEPGEYEFYCNTYCGGGHKDMAGTIIIK